MVHRDVGPQNLMVTYEGRIKLLDFGVAKRDGRPGDTRTGGEVKGKMAYMSPEQALGEPLDRRTDLFSVGAVLFESSGGPAHVGQRRNGPRPGCGSSALDEPPRLEECLPNAPPAPANLYSRLVAARSPPRTAGHRTRRRLRSCGRFALAASPTPDTATARELMTRLFAKDAAERRRLLTQKLERRTAPSQVSELRRSIEPGEIFAQPTWTEPIVLGTETQNALEASMAMGRLRLVDRCKRRSRPTGRSRCGFRIPRGPTPAPPTSAVSANVPGAVPASVAAVPATAASVPSNPAPSPSSSTARPARTVKAWSLHAAPPMSTRRPSDFLFVALLALGAAMPAPAFAGPGDETPFTQYRERFKQGLDRYNEGAFTEAVGYWEPIYRELGEHEGYRLAYNLGVAYMPVELGDATRAADRLPDVPRTGRRKAPAGTAPAAVVAKEGRPDARRCEWPS